MLPTCLEEADLDPSVTPFGEIEIGQRFVDGNGIIFEKNALGEAWVVNGEQAGEFVYPRDDTPVRKIYLKKK